MLLAAPLQLGFLALDIRAVTPSSPIEACSNVILFVLYALYRLGVHRPDGGGLFSWGATGQLANGLPLASPFLRRRCPLRGAHFLGGPVSRPRSSDGRAGPSSTDTACSTWILSWRCSVPACCWSHAPAFRSDPRRERVCTRASSRAQVRQEFTDLNPNSDLAFLAGSLAGSMATSACCGLASSSGGLFIWSRLWIRRAEATTRKEVTRRSCRANRR
jgi:hypothetical protein